MQFLTGYCNSSVIYMMQLITNYLKFCAKINKCFRESFHVSTLLAASSLLLAGDLINCKLYYLPFLLYLYTF